ncbi:hypothetical protein MFLAVUS_007614 [Mucor flavus]|uniref:SURP motif domain-containing protein n=1 Tax=Mucor flavus TaxID=439312 RepID=A0ABP9Z4U8_9FUNG
MSYRNRFTSASLFPDPSLPLARDKRKYCNEEDEEITAFGYESKVYNDQPTAIKVEQGKYLIPWKSGRVGILMDRYDVRHLVQDEKVLAVSEEAILESKYDAERYGMSHESDGKTKAAIRYEYDNKKAKITVTEIEKEIMNKYRTPKSMTVPTDMEQVNIIELVSKEIRTAKDSNLMEIRIQVKNTNNEKYSFLNKRDRLYPFYQHIIKRNLLVEYSDSSDSDN